IYNRALPLIQEFGLEKRLGEIQMLTGAKKRKETVLDFCRHLLLFEDIQYAVPFVYGQDRFFFVYNNLLKKDSKKAESVMKTLADHVKELEEGIDFKIPDGLGNDFYQSEIYPLIILPLREKLDNIVNTFRIDPVKYEKYQLKKLLIEIRTAPHEASSFEDLPPPVPSQSDSCEKDHELMREFWSLWRDPYFFTDEEKRALGLYYGLPDNHGERESKTLEEVGEWLGITRDSVRQILSKAMRKIRNSRRISHLLDHL
ncbi:hypothetical protein GF327_10205, partial [Candidatus Woesearchaeota archaeon]|nr:hypothetical protein [Candidatus Woesearchaeota archaeon]